MDRQSYSVAVAAGDGLVARTGDVVAYIADASPSAGRLIAAVASAAGDQPGAAVAARLAVLAFGAQSPGIAPFGVVAPAAEGLLLLLRGDVTACVETPDATRELSGARALTWVDEVLPAVAHTVTVGGRAGLTVSPHSDLRAGVVPGGGFRLARAGRPASAEPHTAVLTVSVPAAPRPPLSETSTFAPVAGALVADDGAVFVLDRPYVIGRDPSDDAAVRTAQASPIVVKNDQHVSRVHAYVTVEADTVFVRDAATPGGTFIAAPGAPSWTEIGSAPTRLEPGWSLRIGQRIMTYRA